MGPAFNWIPIAGSNPVQQTFIEHARSEERDLQFGSLALCYLNIKTRWQQTIWRPTADSNSNN